MLPNLEDYAIFSVMAKQADLLKIEMPFDEAMRRAVRVPPMPAKKKAKTKKKK